MTEECTCAFAQAVQPEHPMALEFLRRDIRNIATFFQRKGVIVPTFRSLFDIIVRQNLLDQDAIEVGIIKSRFYVQALRLRQKSHWKKSCDIFFPTLFVFHFSVIRKRVTMQSFVCGHDALSSLLYTVSSSWTAGRHCYSEEGKERRVTMRSSWHLISPRHCLSFRILKWRWKGVVHHVPSSIFHFRHAHDTLASLTRHAHHACNLRKWAQASSFHAETGLSR